MSSALELTIENAVQTPDEQTEDQQQPHSKFSFPQPHTKLSPVPDGRDMVLRSSFRSVLTLKFSLSACSVSVGLSQQHTLIRRDYAKRCLYLCWSQCALYFLIYASTAWSQTSSAKLVVTSLFYPMCHMYVEERIVRIGSVLSSC